MNTKNVIFGSVPLRMCRAMRLGVVVMTLGILLYGSSVSAAESASFQLYDSFPNLSNQGPDRSNVFLLNENGVTWVAQPVASTHFQIVTAPPVSSSSVSSVSSGVSTSSVPSTSPSAGGHRGNRIPPVLHPSAGQSSSASFASSPEASSAATAASSDSDSSVSFSGDQLPSAPFVADSIQPPYGRDGLSGALRPSAPCVDDKCQCASSRFFENMCVGIPASLRSRSGIVHTVIQAFLLLLFFCLFFVSRKRCR